MEQKSHKWNFRHLWHLFDPYTKHRAFWNVPCWVISVLSRHNFWLKHCQLLSVFGLLAIFPYKSQILWKSVNMPFSPIIVFAWIIFDELCTLFLCDLLQILHIHKACQSLGFQYKTNKRERAHWALLGEEMNYGTNWKFSNWMFFHCFLNMSQRKLKAERFWSI